MKIFLFILLFSFLTLPVSAQENVPPPSPTNEVNADGTVSEQTAPVPAEPISPEKQEEIDKIVQFFSTAKKNPLPNLSFTIKTKEAGKEKEAKIYLKGDKKRVDSNAYDGAFKNISSFIFIEQNGQSFIYTPNYNFAFRGQPQQGEIVPEVDMEQIHLFSMGENRTYNNIKCRMITSKELFTDICFSEQYMLPIFMKKGPQETMIYDISTEPLDDSLFELPKNVKILN